VQDRPFAVLNLPITAAGIQDAKTKRVAVLDRPAPREAVLYLLCGARAKCAADADLASNDLALIQGEAFEVALRTLNALPQMTSVLVAFPSDSNKLPVLGLYVRRPNVRTLLERPLAKTLGWEQAPAAGSVSDEDARRIAELTLPFTFRLSFDPLQDGSVGLRLLPLSRQQ